MPDDLISLHRETGRTWDVTAALYERDEARDIERLREGWTSFLPAELVYLRGLLPCKRAIHLQCAGGTDTLSLWRLGARLVVGIDISDRMVAVARRKASALGAPATFVACDVLNTPCAFDRTADLVYTGKGALPWMMDLDAWAAVVARLLAPGGALYIHEGHPLDWVWDLEAQDYRLSARTGYYFQREPVPDRNWPATADVVRERAAAQELHVHERQWTLGQIVTAVAGAGLRIERLEEHPEPFWDQFPHLRQELIPLLPHAFSLVARSV
jgi:SAM-dependent methyltransferase